MDKFGEISSESVLGYPHGWLWNFFIGFPVWIYFWGKKSLVDDWIFFILFFIFLHCGCRVLHADFLKVEQWNSKHCSQEVILVAE